MSGPTAAPPAPRIFLLSPAHTGGKRASLLLGGRGRFPLAERLRDGAPVPLGEAFSFLSGLYFRGKVTYARRFARPPAGVSGVQVITSNRGLLPEDTLVTTDDIRSFAETDIQADEPRYREPLVRDLERITRVQGPDAAPAELVLLGSVASGKYVNVLLDVVGERLLFPTEFVGRGDMSRGALLLRMARADRELSYEPVATATRHGPRPRKLEPSHGHQNGASDDHSADSGQR
jgi:hypothetical protein